MKKFLFNKLSLKEYNMLASAPFELTTETEKAVLVKFTTEKEIERLDKVVEEIYDGEYADSAAYTLGFDTVTNLNGRGYENLVRIVDNLNYGRDDEDFARFILGKVFNSHKIEILKREIDTLDF